MRRYCRHKPYAVRCILILAWEAGSRIAPVPVAAGSTEYIILERWVETRIVIDNKT